MKTLSRITRNCAENYDTKMDAILCTVSHWLEDVFDEELEPEICSMKLERPLFQLQSDSNHGLLPKASLTWKRGVILCTRTFWFEDGPTDVCCIVVRLNTNYKPNLWKREGISCTCTFWIEDDPYEWCDALEALFSTCESRKSMGSNQVQTINPGLHWNNGAIVRTSVFWLEDFQPKKDLRRPYLTKAFRPPSYNLATAHQQLLIQKVWWHDKNNNSNEKAEMRLPEGDRVPPMHRVSRSELLLQSNAKHSYKSRRRASNRPRNTSAPGTTAKDEDLLPELPQAKQTPGHLVDFSIEQNSTFAEAKADINVDAEVKIRAEAKAIEVNTAKAEAKELEAAESEAEEDAEISSGTTGTKTKAEAANSSEVKPGGEAGEEPLSFHEDMCHHEDYCIGQEDEEFTYPSTSDMICRDISTEIPSLHSKKPSMLRDLFVKVSKFTTASEVPELMKSQIFEELFTPFLNGGFDSNVSVLLNLTKHPGVMSDSVVPETFHHMDEVPTPEVLDLRDSERPGLELSDRGPVLRHPDFSPSKFLNFTEDADADAPSHINRDLLNNVSEFLHFTDDVDDEKISPINGDLLENIQIEKYDSPDIQLSLGQRTQPNVISGLNSDIYSTPVDFSELIVNDKVAISSEEVHRIFFGKSFTLSKDFNFLEPPALPLRNIRILADEDGLSDKVLGKGCFGRVLESEMRVYPNTVQQVVVKEHYLDKSSQADIIKEAKILMFLEQTGCVPVCYGLLLNECGYWGMVSEMFGSGWTLHHLLGEKNVHTLDWLDIAHQLAMSVSKIHALDILINDLKADNVLVDFTDSMPSVKICDMGSASYKEAVSYNDPNMDMFQHLAPEVRAYHPTSEANDIYGLGRILMKIYHACDLSVFIPIYQQCLIENPSERITMSYLIKLLTEAYSQEIKSYDSHTPEQQQSCEQVVRKEEAQVVECEDTERSEGRMDVELEKEEEIERDEEKMDVEGGEEVECIEEFENVEDDAEVEGDDSKLRIEGEVEIIEEIDGVEEVEGGQIWQSVGAVQEHGDHRMFFPHKSVSREIILFKPNLAAQNELIRSRSREIIPFLTNVTSGISPTHSIVSKTNKASSSPVTDTRTAKMLGSSSLTSLRETVQSLSDSPESDTEQSPFFLTPCTDAERSLTPAMGKLYDEDRSLTISNAEDGSRTTAASSDEERSPTTAASHDEERSPTTAASLDEERSPTTAASLDEERSPTTSASLDEERSPTTAATPDEERSPTTAASHDEERSPTTAASLDEERSPTTAASHDEERSPTTAASLDEERSPTTAASLDEERSPTTSASLDEERFPTTAATPDEERSRTTAASPEKERSRTTAASLDEERSPTTAATPDEERSPTTAATPDEERSPTTAASHDEERSPTTAASLDEERSPTTAASPDEERSPTTAASPDEERSRSAASSSVDDECLTQEEAESPEEDEARADPPSRSVLRPLLLMLPVAISAYVLYKAL